MSPEATLWGLSAWAAIGFALATAAAAEIGSVLGGRRWAVLAVLTCLGAWLSLQLITSDALALGLALTGTAFVLKARPGIAALTFGGAALAKEVYLVFAFAAALWLFGRRHLKPASVVLLVPTAVLGAWAAWLDAKIGSGWSPKGNLAPPFTDMTSSIASWEVSGETVLGLVAIASLVLGGLGAWWSRHPLLIWSVVLWELLAIISSDLVWGGGNNAVRVLAPLWSLGLLGVAIGLEHRSASRQAPVGEPWPAAQT